MHTIDEKKTVEAAINALGKEATAQELKNWIDEHKGWHIMGAWEVVEMSLELVEMNRADLLRDEKQTIWRVIATNPGIGLVTLALCRGTQDKSAPLELMYVYEREQKTLYDWLIDNMHL